MEIERRIDLVAGRQHGLITRQQLTDLGLGRGAIARHVRRGRLLLARPGVFRVLGAPQTWEQAMLAVCLTAPGELWVGHSTAANLWSLRGAPVDEALHVVCSLGSFRRLDGVTCHRSKLLVPADLTVHRRVPTMTAARALVEVAGRLGPTATGRALDDAMRRRVTSLEAFRACHARLAGPGRRRLSPVRAVLAVRLPGYDPGGSDLEIKALTAIARANLPLPVQQHRVVLEGRRRRIDLAYPEVMLAIEMVDWTYHGSRSAHDDDRARTLELKRAGWEVLEFSSAVSEEELVATIRLFLERRGAISRAAAS